MKGEMSGEDRDRFPVAVWWLALALGVLVVGAVVWGVPHEEKNLTARAETALQAAGLGAPAVTFQGRDARLTGTVAHADDVAAAADLVYSLRGVRALDAELHPPPTTPPSPPTTPPSPPTTPPSPSTTAATPSTTAATPSTTAATTSTTAAATSTIAATPPSPPTTAATTIPAPELPEVVVFFEVNSSELSGEARATLESAADVLIANPSLEAVAVGHTDRRDTEVYNQGLSEGRASAVVAYLVGRGVEEARLSRLGCGERALADESDTPEAHAANRRVELVALDELAAQRKEC